MIAPATLASHAWVMGAWRTLVVAGLLNKRVGARLVISEVTVKAHRGRVMEKMQAASFADLVRMSAVLSG